VLWRASLRGRSRGGAACGEDGGIEFLGVCEGDGMGVQARFKVGDARLEVVDIAGRVSRQWVEVEVMGLSRTFAVSHAW
jgi:hypothetical protein